MVFFALILVLVLCAAVFAQQPPATAAATPSKLGSLDVRLNIENQAFNIRFEPEKQSATQMAQQLCTQRASLLGVTEETLSICVDKVGKYLQGSVDEWVKEKIAHIPLTVNNQSFQLDFIPERSQIDLVAQKFCVDQAATLGVTDATLKNCVQNISPYLSRQVQQFFTEKTLTVPVPIDGQTFQVSFLPERHPSDSVAARLCREQATALKLDSNELLGLCVTKVAAYLDENVDAWINSKTLAFTMNVNGQPFKFAILPERQPAVNVARDFCVEKAAAFGLTKETIVPNCITPVTDYVRKQVTQWVNSKRLVVPVKIAGQDVNLSLFPERESSVDVARRFCVTNAGKLKLTEDNVVKACIAPLNNVIGNAVNEWAAARTATKTA